MSKRLLYSAVLGTLMVGLGGGTVAGMQTPSPTSPPSEADIAASPAAQLLKEAIAAVGRDEEAIRSFIAANAVPWQRVPLAQQSGARPPLYHLLNWRYRTQGGLTLLNFMKVTPTMATARARNPLTGEIEGVAFELEPNAPHRIVWAGGLGPGAPAVTQEPATFGSTEEAARLKELSSFIDRLAKADVFSGVVLVARNGTPVFQQAYGYADREKRIPNGIDTRFRMASMTKMLTAFAIGQLVDQGKLSYDDPLSKFLPDFPNPESAQAIRVKHLLSHTSGINGEYSNASFWSNIEKMTDLASVMAVIEPGPKKFEPGTQHAYSNTGFLLLGRIIEVVTGQNYHDYMEEKLFKPLGMANTGFPNYDRAGPDIARPYEALLDDNEVFQQVVAPKRTRRGLPSGDGATTAQDMLRFSIALQGGKVVKPETVRLHSTPKPELASPNYGYGMMISAGSYGTMSSARVPGRDVVGHSGEATGTCTEFGIVRDTPLPYTVIVLSNSSQGTCHTVGRRIYNTLAPRS